MKAIMSLLVLFVNIGYTTAVIAQTNHVRQTPLARQLQIDRYTGYKTNATLEEVNPLLVITQINFPSHVKTVHDAIEHALQRSGYRVDWQQSVEAYDVFSELEMPIVHRKLSLMTLKDAIATLAGEVWQLFIDSVNRKLVIQLHDDVSWQVTDASNGEDMLGLDPEEATIYAEKTKANHPQIASAIASQITHHNHPGNYSNSYSMPATVSEYEVDDASSTDTPKDNSQHIDSGVSLRQESPQADVIYYAAEENVDEYDQLSDFTETNKWERGSIEIHEEMPDIHSVQYIPDAQSESIELPRTDSRMSYENRSDRHFWSVQPAIKPKKDVGSLDEAVIVHYDSISVRELIEILIPEGWVVHYEVSDAILRQKLVSHAESSRRSALFALCKELNLKALFYPGQAVVLVAEKGLRSPNYSNSPLFKTIDNQATDKSLPSSSDVSKTTELQQEMSTILKNATIIQDLMKRMEPVPK